jgi:hypothetical protein
MLVSSLFRAPLELSLREVAIARVEGLEFCAVDGGDRM